jgi:hypothetical protein
MMAIDFEKARLTREALYIWQRDCLDAYREWILETAKTLAIVNSAGLAGVSAIYAGATTGTTLLGNYPSAAFFAVGLVCAIFDMYTNSVGHIRRHAEVMSRIRSLDKGDLDPDIALGEANSGEPWFRAADVTGWASGILFLAGGWPFVKPAVHSLVQAMCQ